MKYVNPPPYLEGNLTEVPAGLSFKEMKQRFNMEYNRVSRVDMNMTTQYSNKLSQRMFYEKIKDNFGNTPLKVEIFVAGQHKWTFTGTPEEIRNYAYRKAMELGAILNRRVPKDENGKPKGPKPKTNRNCSFRIRSVYA